MCTEACLKVIVRFQTAWSSDAVTIYIYFKQRLTVAHVSWQNYTSILTHLFELKPGITYSLDFKRKSVKASWKQTVVSLYKFRKFDLHSFIYLQLMNVKREKKTRTTTVVMVRILWALLSSVHIHSQVCLAFMMLQACGECLACEKLQLTAVTSYVKIWPSLPRVSSSCLLFTHALLSLICTHYVHCASLPLFQLLNVLYCTLAP